MLPQARPSAPAYMPHQILLALRVRSQNTSLQSGQRRSRDQEPPASAAATASTTPPGGGGGFGAAWPEGRGPALDGDGDAEPGPLEPAAQPGGVLLGRGPRQ